MQNGDMLFYDEGVENVSIALPFGLDLFFQMQAFFNGGGHLNAAGGQMDLPLAEVVRKVKETIPWFFEQLKNSGI